MRSVIALMGSAALLLAVAGFAAALPTTKISIAGETVEVGGPPCAVTLPFAGCVTWCTPVFCPEPYDICQYDPTGLICDS
jgi:hypothetical protein